MKKLPVMWSVVCDDVRNETGNKVSLMGIYSGKILFPAFPAVLPKLCFFVTARFPAKKLPGNLVVRIEKDGESIGEQVIDISKLPISEISDALEGEESFMSLSVIFQFLGLEFTQPCRLRVRGRADELELKAGTVSVGLAPTTAPTS